MSQDYLPRIRKLAENALTQTGAVMVCEHHKGVLLHKGNGEAEHIAYNLASVWIKKDVGTFMREDLRDAIKGILDRAAKDGCPKCARMKDN
jgi:hypothetical protein